MNLASLEAGDELPALDFGPISRTTLALFAGASGDHNPIHIDIDVAKSAGRPDVFAHGMLSMACLARAVTRSIPQRHLREYGVRFMAITEVGDRIRCTARVDRIVETSGERLATLSLKVENQEGRVTLLGSAIVELPAGGEG